MDSEWAREQRVCSSSYFEKFFAYGVSNNPVSDRRLQQFLDALPTLAPAKQDAALLELATPETVASLVQRLRQREEHVPPPIALALAPLIARNGELFRSESGASLIEGSFNQAEIVVHFLIKSVVDRTDRLKLASEVLSVAEPLKFASECLFWMSPSASRAASEWLFDEESFGQLVSQFAMERIKRADAREPLYRQFGPYAPALYAWWHDVDATALASRLSACLEADSAEVDEFLDAFASEARPGSSRRLRLGRATYDSVAQLIEPEKIAQRLRARYGEQLDKLEFDQDDDIALPVRIAHQFMWVHVRVLAEADQQAQA